MTQSHDYNLSFSGMKTHARNFLQKNWGQNEKSRTQESHKKNSNPQKRAHSNPIQPLTSTELTNFTASLQYAVFRHICYKLNKILLDFFTHSLTQSETELRGKENQLKTPIQSVWLGGGVASNATLRKMIRQTLQRISSHKTNGSPKQQLQLKTPYTKKLCTDNAGMVGVTFSLNQ